MKTVSCYFPGPRFPSVSVTGSRCGLECPHCMGVPLSAMLPAETPDALLSLANKLSDDDAVGFLLSGGCGADGVVPLGGFSDAVRSVKDATHLKVNAHIGYPRREAVDRLVKAGIDAFSVTFPMSDKIGKRYLGIDNALARYEETVDALRSRGARAVPHALIGLGDRTEDDAGLSALASYDPKSLVLIIFTPLRGTPLSTVPAAPDTRIVETLAFARSSMQRANLVLGCMRPRGRTEMEARLIEESLDGIVMPSAAAIRAVSGKVILERYEGCCALYL
jgi:uncharacterized radical SAM superfamily protein